jgi:hypothetical protein
MGMTALLGNDCAHAGILGNDCADAIAKCLGQAHPIVLARANGSLAVLS